MNEEIKGENRAPTRTPLDIGDERDEASMGIGRLRRTLRHAVRVAMNGEIGPAVSAGVASAALLAVSTELDPGAALAGDAWWAAVDGASNAERVRALKFEEAQRAHLVAGHSPEMAKTLAEMARPAPFSPLADAEARILNVIEERDAWRKKAEENAGAAALHRDIGHVLGVVGGGSVLDAAERLRRAYDAIVRALGIEDPLIDPMQTARNIVAERNLLSRTLLDREAELVRLGAWISPQHRAGGSPIPVEALTPAQRALFDQCKDLAGGAFELLANVVGTGTRTTWAASLHYATSIDTQSPSRERLDADRTGLLEQAVTSLRRVTGKQPSPPEPDDVRARLLDWAAREVAEVASDFGSNTKTALALHRAMSRIRKGIAQRDDGAPIGPELAKHLRTMPGDALKAGTTPLSLAPFAVRFRAQKKAWTWARTEGKTGVVVRFDDVHRASDAVTDLVRATPNVEFQVVRYLTNGDPADAFAEGPIRSWHGKAAKKGAKR